MHKIDSETVRYRIYLRRFASAVLAPIRSNPKSLAFRTIWVYLAFDSGLHDLARTLIDRNYDTHLSENPISCIDSGFYPSFRRDIPSGLA